MRLSKSALASVAAPIMLFSAPAFSGQPLETETARLLHKGGSVIASSFEIQSSPEGKETAWPWLIEYGLTDRIELAVEPVAHASVNPKTGRKATGVGDIEATMTFLLAGETARRPAVALAAEVKLPVAKDRLIGTGQTDFAGYVIVSRRFAKLDLHGNLGYTVLGRPAGMSLNNVFSFALAGEYHSSARWELVGELFANTSAAPGLGESGSVIKTPVEQTAELTGGEAFAMVGSRYHIAQSFTVDLGLVYDNNNALLIRPGITLEF